MGLKINFSNVVSIFHFVDLEEGRAVKIRYSQQDEEKEKDVQLVLATQQQAQEWSEMLKEFLVAIDNLKTEQTPANAGEQEPEGAEENDKVKSKSKKSANKSFKALSSVTGAAKLM